MVYILSQIFTILNYSIIGSTYFVNSKNKILFLNIANSLFELMADLLLGGYTGVCMCIVAVIRNIYIYFNADMSNKKRNISCLAFFAIIAILSLYSYSDRLSLLIVFATWIYTYSVFQKSVKTYKILGIPVEILYISYNVYLRNISGITLESLLFCCTIIGYLMEFRKNKNLKEEIKHE